MIKKLFARCPCKIIQDPPRIGSQGQFTITLVVILVVLRLAIGFHFFSEGASKIHDPDFSSVGFLSAAKGPFSGFYRGFLKDPDGLQRLNYNSHSETRNKTDVEQTLTVWSAHLQRVAGHYGFGPGQTRLGQRAFSLRKLQLQNFYLENGPDINEYFQNLERGFISWR